MVHFMLAETGAFGLKCSLRDEGLDLGLEFRV